MTTRKTDQQIIAEGIGQSLDAFLSPGEKHPVMFRREKGTGQLIAAFPNEFDDESGVKGEYANSDHFHRNTEPVDPSDAEAKAFANELKSRKLHVAPIPANQHSGFHGFVRIVRG